jgi:hypothetical protein
MVSYKLPAVLKQLHERLKPMPVLIAVNSKVKSFAANQQASRG